MAATSPQLWFGIRGIYLFGRKKDGTNLFEERIVVFSGSTADEALSKAQQEADAYASHHQMSRHPRLVAYEQDGDPLIDGYEVWSEVFESSEDLQAFVASRYERYEYHPDK